MKRDEMQGKGVEVLKTFNNSISTSRLYPPEAPQVATAIDRGYKSIKEYLRHYRQLEFTLQDGQPYLNGAPLQQEVLDGFPNLHIYRQLKVLGLSSLRIAADMDRFSFNQLITIFQASVAKIEEHGGGVEFVTALGLTDYFLQSDTKETKDTAAGGKTDQDKKIVKVRPELVSCLLGQDKRPLVIEDLKKRIVVIDSSVAILAATIARILQGIRTKKKIVAAAEFPKMLRTAETLIPKEYEERVMEQLAELLAASLKDSALCVLFCQNFPSPFGTALYNHLTNGLSGNRVGRVIVAFREQLARAKSKGTKDPEVQLLGKSLLSLMNSEKGKIFLSAEKAKSIIHEGERQRTRERLNSGISSILEGDYQVLENDEFMSALPEGMLEMHRGPKGDYVPKVLKSLIIYLGRHQGKGSTDVLNCLLEIGDNFLENNFVRQVEMLAEPLIKVARRASLGPRRFEKTLSFLQKLMRASWAAGEQELGDKILMLFYQMRSGQIEKNDDQRGIVGQVQDRGIDRRALPLLLKDSLANPKDEALSYRLVLQGPIALRFLVDSLIETEGSIDRVKIIDLLTYDTSHLHTIIKERLPNHMPWFGKRNLLKLLGESGASQDAASALAYLKHADYRVQREAFLCMYKIGGQQRKRLFLEALDISSEVVTIQIVEAFAAFCDQEVATRLAIILDEYTNFSEHTREPLLLALFDTLGRCPCNASLKVVQNFIEVKRQKAGKAVSSRVLESAEKALHFLKNDMQAQKKKHIQASQLRKVALQQVAKKNKVPVSQRVITGLPEEQVIRNLLSKSEMGEAVSRLLLLIEQTARTGNFVQAEQLKEWLADIHPSEPANVLKATEIITSEKIAVIDKGHLEVWAGLYDVLTTSEFSELFESLQHKRFSIEESIVAQGEEQNALFFVNSGEVKIFFREDEEDFLITTMKSGEIFGADAFFEPSIWTMSVTSIGESEVSLLPVDVLQRWSEEYPDLEEKLLRFCEQFERVESLIVKSSRDRRVHKRHQVTRGITTNLIDLMGRNTGITNEGRLIDISKGGLAYMVQLDHKGSRRQLLGRKVRIDLPTTGDKETVTTVSGNIVSVKSRKESQEKYSVHMKFDLLVDEQVLYDIIQACRLEPTAKLED